MTKEDYRKAVRFDYDDDGFDVWSLVAWMDYLFAGACSSLTVIYLLA